MTKARTATNSPKSHRLLVREVVPIPLSNEPGRATCLPNCPRRHSQRLGDDVGSLVSNGCPPKRLPRALLELQADRVEGLPDYNGSLFIARFGNTTPVAIRDRQDTLIGVTAARCLGRRLSILPSKVVRDLAASDRPQPTPKSAARWVALENKQSSPPRREKRLGKCPRDPRRARRLLVGTSGELAMRRRRPAAPKPQHHGPSHDPGSWTMWSLSGRGCCQMVVSRLVSVLLCRDPRRE